MRRKQFLKHSSVIVGGLVLNPMPIFTSNLLGTEIKNKFISMLMNLFLISVPKRLDVKIGIGLSTNPPTITELCFKNCFRRI